MAKPNPQSGWKKSHSLNEIQPSLNGLKVKVGGYVQTIRKIGKNLRFIILRGNKVDCQITCIKDEMPKHEYDKIAYLSPESVVGVEGIIHKTEQTPRGVEILPEKIEILSIAEAPLPLEIYGQVESVLDTRLNWRSLDLRNKKNTAIFFIQSKLVEGALEYLVKNEYTIVNTPCLMGVPSESGSEMFEVPYFDKKAYLRQDPQLHRQLTIVAGFEKIVDIGPSWRAELSHTTRHLCEHRGIAVEKAFIQDETDTMRLEENVIIAAFQKVKKECQEELNLFGISVEIPTTPFPEIRYPEIYNILNSLGKKIEYGKDHDTESEELLAGYVKKNWGHDFFFINRFPFSSKPFYVMRDDEDQKWARSVDLIYRGVEQSSGGQREHRYDYLRKNAKEKRMRNISWFTDAFKYGAPPHGGFNIGIERLTYKFLDIKNIREATLFPRDPDRLVP